MTPTCLTSVFWGQVWDPYVLCPPHRNINWVTIMQYHVWGYMVAVLVVVDVHVCVCVGVYCVVVA